MYSYRPYIVYLLVAASFVSSASASSLDDISNSLRPSVVSVQSTDDSMTQRGFGFIVGADNDGVYVVTANHTVRRNVLSERETDITVRFWKSNGERVPAQLLPFIDKRRDLAVLYVKPPRGVMWNTATINTQDLRRGDDVVYIGRANEWYVPSVSGAVNDPRSLNENIIVDGLQVRIGTSGAPLVSNAGVVGMIVTNESDDVARALRVDFIQRFFQKQGLPWTTDALPPESFTAMTVKDRESVWISDPRGGASAFSETRGSKLWTGTPNSAIDDQKLTRFEVRARPQDPFDLDISLPSSAPWYVSAVEMEQDPQAKVSEYLKSFEIFVRLNGNYNWQKVYEGELQQDLGTQKFHIEPREATHIRLRILGPWGSGTVFLGSLRVYGSK